jgi:putative endonuclease
MVFTEEFALKTDALERERFLKKQRNREFYLKLIASKTY